MSHRCFFLLVLFLMLVIHFPTGNAVCCDIHRLPQCHNFYGPFYCDDCSRADPYCGKGACNMFGCNCDGGCRPKTDLPCDCKKFIPIEKGTAEHSPHPPMANLVAYIDIDGDGRLSAKEVAEWAAESQVDKQKMIRGFLEMDTNRDGYLSLKEIDSDWQ